MRNITLATAAVAAMLVLPASSAVAQSSTRHSHTTRKTSERPTRAHSPSRSTSKKAAPSRERASMDGAWKSIYSDSDVALSLDSLQTQRQPDGTFNVRLRWQYSSDKPIGRMQSYRTLVERRIVNCTFMGSKPVTAQTFSGTGRPVSSFTSTPRDLKYMDWGVRRGGTSGSRAYAALCGTLK